MKLDLGEKIDLGSVLRGDLGDNLWDNLGVGFRDNLWLSLGGRLGVSLWLSPWADLGDRA